MDERDRNPEKDRNPVDDGYFGWPPGRGQVQFLDEDGKPMTPEEFDAYVERRKRREAWGGRNDGR